MNAHESLIRRSQGYIYIYEIWEYNVLSIKKLFQSKEH